MDHLHARNTVAACGDRDAASIGGRVAADRAGIESQIVREDAASVGAAELPLIVLLLTRTLLVKRGDHLSMPPPLRTAELPLIVLSRDRHGATIARIPPPSRPAELPLIVLFETNRDPP